MHYGIIAAGEGSRLVSEGVALPKPLVDIDGRPMIGRLLQIFTDTGAESVSVIVNEQMTEVAQYLRSLQNSLPVPLRLIVKSTPSSMHSFFELSRGLDAGTRLVLTTVDTIFRPADLRRYVDAFENAAGVDAMMAVTSHVDDEKPLYVDVAPDGRVDAFCDSRPSRDDRPVFVSGGIYGLTSPCIQVLEQCMADGVSRMRNYQRALIDAGLDVRAFDMGRILDVDHASDILKARDFLNS